MLYTYSQWGLRAGKHAVVNEPRACRLRLRLSQVNRWKEFLSAAFVPG
jgi:hypothetical protein